MSYRVITWTNLGNRLAYETRDLADAMAWAKGQRTPHNRTVKVAHLDDAIRHWTRTDGLHGNQWSSRATAECSR